MFLYPAQNFFYLTLSYHIWHMGLSPREDVSSTFMILIRRWPLTDLKVKFIGFMTWLCVQASAFCPLTKSYFVWHVSVFFEGHKWSSSVFKKQKIYQHNGSMKFSQILLTLWVMSLEYFIDNTVFPWDYEMRYIFIVILCKAIKLFFFQCIIIYLKGLRWELKDTTLMWNTGSGKWSGYNFCWSHWCIQEQKIIGMYMKRVFRVL